MTDSNPREAQAAGTTYVSDGGLLHGEHGVHGDGVVALAHAAAHHSGLQNVTGQLCLQEVLLRTGEKRVTATSPPHWSGKRSSDTAESSREKSTDCPDCPQFFWLFPAGKDVSKIERLKQFSWILHKMASLKKKKKI